MLYLRPDGACTISRATVLKDSAYSRPHRAAVACSVLALTLVAALLRVWRLGELPAGLHFDEAAHGVLVQQHIFRGETPIFFSAYTGHEALFHYTLAPFLALFGPTILALRLPAALWSTFLAPVVYLLGARMWNWRVGLLAAVAAAMSGWGVHVGRIAFRANTLPVVSALAVFLLYAALQSQRRRDWMLAGACFGLSLYTYLAVRVLPLLGPLLLIYLALWHRPLLRRCRQGVLFFVLALVLVSLPLAVHMLRVPGDLLERTRQIGLPLDKPSAAVRAVAKQTWATLLMFGVEGARDDFFNFPGRPVFPGLAALPFYAGALLALLQVRHLACALVLLWLGVMLLPTILATDAPHWLRAIGAQPPAFLLWGLGAGAAWDWMSRRWRYGLPAGAVGALLIAGLWLTSTAREYFVAWARRPEVYYDYMQYATDAALAALDTPAADNLLLSEEYYRHATYLFLAPRARSAQWFDARKAVVWPRHAPWTAIVSATTPTPPDINVLLQQARAEPYAPDGNYAYTKLTGETIPPFAPPHRIEGRFGEVLALQGFDIKGKLRGGETLHLQLYCHAVAAADRELRIFVHLEGADGRIIAQDDALGYDAREWQPGDRFIGVHDLKLPDALPADPPRLIVGLYDVVTGERYPLGGAGGHSDYIEIPLSSLNEA